MGNMVGGLVAELGRVPGSGGMVGSATIVQALSSLPVEIRSE